MSILNIVCVPNEILSKKSEEVLIIDKSIKKIVKNMYETMKKHNGIGLAAVQVGILKRIVVIEIEDIKLDLINPRIISFSEKKTPMVEGCLSVPKNTYEVERPESVVVEYTDLNNIKQVIEATGLLSKCLQHEIDHLNGITIINRGIKIKE